MDRTARRNIAIISGTWALMGPFSSAVNVYGSLFILGLGGGPVEVGIISMAGAVTLAFSRLIGGYLADSIGRKSIMAPMTIAYGISILMYVFARDWTWILLGSILSSLALMYQPALQAIMFDSLPPDKRGKGISIANAPSQLASLAGPPIATVVVASMGLMKGMRFLYMLVVISTVASGIIRFFLVEIVENKVEVGIRHGVNEYIKALRMLKGDLGKLILTTSSVSALYNMAYPYVQIFAVKHLGITIESWGIISTVVTIWSTFTNLLSGSLADKVGRNVVMSLGYASGSMGLAMLAFAPKGNAIYLLISLIVNSLFSSGPAAQALLSDLTDINSRGKVIAISGLLEGNAAGCMSAVGGVLYSTIAQLMFVIPATALVPIVIMTWRELPRGLTGMEGNSG
ncbi:MAG: MFS transporter [Candidatus Methanodesulfokora sp.]